jgi:hypothetical protein
MEINTYKKLEASCTAFNATIVQSTIKHLSLYSVLPTYYFLYMAVLGEVYLFIVDCGAVGLNAWNKENINPLKTKHRLLYLKTQSVPHSKHFSSRL